MIDTSMPYIVGDWRVEARRHILIDSTGETLRLPPKTIDVLCLLASRQGEVISRSEILDQIWQSGNGGDDSLNNAISSLRTAFGDDRKNPRYIETIPKRGYRLAAQVTNIEDNQAGVDDATSRPIWTRPAIQAWGGGAIFSFGALIFFLTADWDTRPERDSDTVNDVRVVTSLPGVERDAQISPDKNRMIFSHDGDIYLSSLASNDAQQLTRTPARDIAPAWLPGGIEIAFMRRDGNRCELLVRNMTDATLRSLGACALATFPALAAHPTEPWLAYSELAPQTGFLDLVWVDTVSGAHSQQTITAPDAASASYFYFRFSPDGEKIAFVRSQIKRDQVLYADIETPADDLTTANAASFPKIGPPAATPLMAERINGIDWLGNNGLIASIAEQYRATLQQYDLFADVISTLPVPSDNPIFPMASRDGAMIIWSDAYFDMDIWSAAKTSAGAFEERKIVNSTKLDAFPAISPDGMKLAFLSSRSGSLEVWLADADGGNQRQLTFFSSEVTSPVWAPDSGSLIFSALVDDQFDIWTIAHDEADPRRITSSKEDEIVTGWGTNASSVLFFTDAGGTYSVNEVTVNDPSKTRRLLEGATYAKTGCNKTQLFFFRSIENGLWRHDLTGNEEVQVVSELDAVEPDAWAVGKKGVYYLTPAPDGIANLMIAPCAGGAAQKLADIGGMAPFHHLSLSLVEDEDGEHLYFAKTDQLEADIMISSLAN